MSNLFDPRVPNCVNIVRNVMPHYSTKQDFLRYNILHVQLRVYEYTKIQGALEKISHHCQKAILERDQLCASPHLWPKINRMLITSLICIQ